MYKSVKCGFSFRSNDCCKLIYSVLIPGFLLHVPKVKWSLSVLASLAEELHVEWNCIAFCQCHCIGMDKMFVQTFPYDVREKAESTFWPTLYNKNGTPLELFSLSFHIIHWLKVKRLEVYSLDSEISEFTVNSSAKSA